MKNNTIKSNTIARRKRKMSKAERTLKYTILFFIKLYRELKKLFVRVLKVSSFCGAMAALLVILSPFLYLIAYAAYCSNTEFWNAVINFNGDIIGAFNTFFSAIN